VLEYFKAVENPQFVDWALGEISSFLRETDNKEIQEIALILVSKLDVERLFVTVELFEETSIEESILDCSLDQIIKKDRAAALNTVLEIYNNYPNYRVQAETRLLELGQTPSLLAQWAISEPDSFCNREILSSVTRRISTNQIRKAFRDAFNAASHRQILALLERLPGGMDKVDQVVFAALESGAAPRDCHRLPRQISERGVYQYDCWRDPESQSQR
jgi:hypothetical protein